MSAPSRRVRSRSSKPLLQNPEWHDTTRSQVERLIGGSVEDYSYGTYTSSSVRAYARSDGTVDMIWDPGDLQLDLAAVRQIDQAVSTGISADDELATLIFAAHVVARASRAKWAELQIAMRNQPREVPVRKILPPINSSDWHLLDRWANEPSARARAADVERARDEVLNVRSWLAQHDPTAAALLTRGPLGFAWPQRWMAGGRLPADERAVIDSLPSAMRHCDEVSSIWMWNNDPQFAAYDHPSSVCSAALDARSTLARRYLDTVSWWGPSPEDDATAERLDEQLDPSERGGKTGYDPWGRLVRLSRAGRAFTVEWPAIPPTHLPDDAHVVGDPATGPAAVFVQLPDGRLDLLPVEPGEDYGPEFTWGYYGGGPTALAGALYYLCTGRSSARGPQTTEEVEARRTLAPLIAQQGKQLNLNIAELRELLAAASDAD